MIASSTMPGHLIRRLHQKSTQVFTRHVRAAGYDLTPVQFAALDALSHVPGIDQAGLADAVGKDPATIGAVVDRLAQKGLLTRVKSSADRRARVLELTGEGKAVLDALLPVVEGLQAEILGGLDAAEYRQFVRLAAKAALTGGGGYEEG
ncbi:MAG: MarR family transcriptional regulator [Zhengella sp.]|uniref:MarR family winged helix-turn-helix transcriptional regulator n=1 Tax=Zhengella sp. TaxID=2282762 RepID=UPI001D2083C0|nr:MarR family transcriptional regulator [Notoacmeibacter sp.]MCC0027768.1 MarR family transcriptional regulator [Brucellaceae bacterium]